jgi:hypothetical protein
MQSDIDFEKLVKDEDYYVRWDVANNPKCPENLKMELLLSDSV